MPPAKTDAENIATAKKAFIALMLEAGYVITENDITASIDNDTYRCNRSSHNVDLNFKCFRCHESCGKQLQAARKAIRKAWCKSCNQRDINTKNTGPEDVIAFVRARAPQLASLVIRVLELVFRETRAEGPATVRIERCIVQLTCTGCGDLCGCMQVQALLRLVNGGCMPFCSFCCNDGKIMTLVDSSGVQHEFGVDAYTESTFIKLISTGGKQPACIKSQNGVMFRLPSGAKYRPDIYLLQQPADYELPLLAGQPSLYDLRTKEGSTKRWYQTLTLAAPFYRENDSVAKSMDVVDIECISTALMREEGADIIDACNKVFKRFYFGVMHDGYLAWEIDTVEKFVAARRYAEGLLRRSGSSWVLPPLRFSDADRAERISKRRGQSAFPSLRVNGPLPTLDQIMGPNALTLLQLAAPAPEGQQQQQQQQPAAPAAPAASLPAPAAPAAPPAAAPAPAAPAAAAPAPAAAPPAAAAPAASPPRKKQRSIKAYFAKP